MSHHTRFTTPLRLEQIEARCAAIRAAEAKRKDDRRRAEFDAAANRLGLCARVTKAGTRCRRRAANGSSFCSLHKD